MNISGISNNVQALLADTNEFVTVLAAPPSETANFAGYPSASHYYVNAESNYATVSQNRRVLEYIIEIYLVTGNETPSATDLQEAYILTDKIMDMLDHTIDLSDTGLGLTRACDLMRPTPSSLEAIVTPEGPGLMMTIRLFCEGDVTFRNA